MGMRFPTTETNLHTTTMVYVRVALDFRSWRTGSTRILDAHPELRFVGSPKDNFLFFSFRSVCKFASNVGERRRVRALGTKANRPHV